MEGITKLPNRHNKTKDMMYMKQLIWHCHNVSAVRAVRNRMRTLVNTTLKFNTKNTGFEAFGGNYNGEIQPRFLGNPDGPGDVG